MQNVHKVATFKERFSSLFDESEKTTTELSKELRVSNQTISAWKTGARSPKEPTIIAIAKYFGVDEMWLMGFNVEKEAKNAWVPFSKNVTDKELDVLETIHQNPRLGLLFDRSRKMSAEDIEVMLRFADGVLKERDGDE